MIWYTMMRITQLKIYYILVYVLVDVINLGYTLNMGRETNINILEIFYVWHTHKMTAILKLLALNIKS